MIGSIAIGLLGLLTLSIPVGIVLFLLGFGIDAFYSPFPLIKGLGNLVWSTSNNATLIAIPFFVLLGDFGVDVVQPVLLLLLLDDFLHALLDDTLLRRGDVFRPGVANHYPVHAIRIISDVIVDWSR